MSRLFSFVGASIVAAIIVGGLIVSMADRAGWIIVIAGPCALLGLYGLRS
jgi:hypothetical protein